MSATCRSCGAEIIWGFTRTGKRMPLDAEPVSGGKWWISESSVIAPRPPTKGLGHESHFATCPDADKHRRPR